MDAPDKAHLEWLEREHFPELAHQFDYLPFQPLDTPPKEPSLRYKPVLQPVNSTKPKTRFQKWKGRVTTAAAVVLALFVLYSVARTFTFVFNYLLLGH